MAEQPQQLTETSPPLLQLTLTFENRDWLLPLSDFLMGIGVASVEIQMNSPVLQVILLPFKNPEKIIQAIGEFCGNLSIPIPGITLKTLENQDWMAVFRKHFAPFAMNRNSFIVPSWLKEEYPGTVEGKQVIVVEPGQAFGTGLHATTALAADMVTDYGKGHPGFTMIDAGSGSGILSLIAEKNGADKIVAFDVDPLCSTAMATHLSLNRSAIEKFHFFIGTEAAIRPDTKVDLIVINIIETIIRRILPSLSRMATDQLILSGILKRDTESFIHFVNKQGFRVLEQDTRDEWIAFRCEKN